MITYRQLTLEDRDTVYAAAKAAGYVNCESSFGVQYIWRKAYGFEIAIEDGFVLIRQSDGETPTSNYSLLGSGDINALLLRMADQREDKTAPLLFSCAPKAFADRVTALFGERATVSEARARFDYIYKSTDLANLEGKKFHGKRNHVNRFSAIFKCEVQPITAENIPVALELNREWCRETENCCNEAFDEERCAVANLFANFSALNGRGLLLFAEGKPAAYTAGTPLFPGSNVFDVHFEKALKKFDGAYSAINNFFAKELCGEYEYLNREEDMGIEGLRKAKLSYNPAILLEKYDIEIR